MIRSKSSLIPPYVSYKTFLGFLASLKAQGIPSRIDRSVLSQKSGSVQSQLLLAFNYLGLLGQGGRPAEHLHQLINSQGSGRRAILREITESAYQLVFDSGVNLETATSEEIEELFAQTGASGETLRRSIAFFLALAREGGIPISPYIRPHRKKGRSQGRTGAAKEDSSESPALPNPEKGPETKRVHLRSGGQLRLELSVKLFELDAEDREFVFSLVDQLTRYQGQIEDRAGRTPPEVDPL